MVANNINYNTKCKWVINLTNNPLTTVQQTLLARGPNYAKLPKYPPKEAYITVIEKAFSQLPNREAKEFRSDTSRILMHQCTHIKPNLNLEECKALTQFREDTSRMVLTVDKEVAIVIMDKLDYTSKTLALLADTNTYRILNKDPTTKFKK